MLPQSALLLTIFFGPFSRSRVDKLWSSGRDFCRHHPDRDVVGCRYHWRLLGAVITFRYIFSIFFTTSIMSQISYHNDADTYQDMEHPHS